MRRSTAGIGSAVFFLAAPCTVVGLVPWLITRWEFHHPTPFWVLAQTLGGALICAGLVPLVHAFSQFTNAGGTPMPLAAPRRLVVSGFNRHVRNPMYVGLLLGITGQALLFGQAVLLLYAAAVWAATAAFVRGYEEPTLANRFGAAYQEYRRAVPAWRPRLHGWTPSTPNRSGPSRTSPPA